MKTIEKQPVGVSRKLYNKLCLQDEVLYASDSGDTLYLKYIDIKQAESIEEAMELFGSQIRLLKLANKQHLTDTINAARKIFTAPETKSSQRHAIANDTTLSGDQKYQLLLEKGLLF